MEEDEFEIALKKEFLNEATELLDECEAVFLELEKDINSEDAIDRIFRAAHTIKGGALTVGLHSFGSFAHVFENLLVAIRNGDMSISSEIIDTLLRK
ncbi:MAG: Hpt domain-containing protein [Bdellovibrionota bacterium]